MKHQIRIVGITILLYPQIENVPSLFGEMLYNGFFQREAGKIRPNNQIFILYCFHNQTFSLICIVIGGFCVVLSFITIIPPKYCYAKLQKVAWNKASKPLFSLI